eukprot:4018677-Amphidinium_carterae.2
MLPWETSTDVGLWRVHARQALCSGAGARPMFRSITPVTTHMFGGHFLRGFYNLACHTPIKKVFGTQE